MFEYLAEHHQWVGVLAVAWVVYGLSSRIYGKIKRKRELKQQNNTGAMPDVFGGGMGTTSGNSQTSSGYGGGNAGGAGSTRGFVANQSVPVTTNTALDNVGMMASLSGEISDGTTDALAENAVAAADTVLSSGVTTMAESAGEAVNEALSETILAAAGEAIESTVEAVGEVAGEVASEIISEIVTEIIKE